MNYIPERIELPVFPKSVKVHRRDEYIDAVRDPDRTHFVRSLFLGFHPLEKLDLVRIIDIADEERQQVAELCGAMPIDAHVALYNTVNEDITPPTKDDSGKHVPKGYRLVAEVPVIRDFRSFLTNNPPEEHTDAVAYERANIGLQTYHSKLGEGDLYLSDMFIFQFGLDATKQACLIDPDPIVKQK